MTLTIQTHRRVRVIQQLLAAFAFSVVAVGAFAVSEPEQSKVSAPAGDDWQVLSATPAAGTQSTDTTSPGPIMAAPAQTGVSNATAAVQPAATSLAVTPVVLPAGSASSGQVSLTITPQDVNLRNALDRWLQTQGWQLAWKIDDDLPLEFNATFTGDFTSVLTQVMQATNHMRTPTRICRHTNNVIRVIARAANCQD
jgi:hypothetical protein